MRTEHESTGLPIIEIPSCMGILKLTDQQELPDMLFVLPSIGIDVDTELASFVRMNKLSTEMQKSIRSELMVKFGMIGVDQ